MYLAARFRAVVGQFEIRQRGLVGVDTGNEPGVRVAGVCFQKRPRLLQGSQHLHAKAILSLLGFIRSGVGTAV